MQQEISSDNMTTIQLWAKLQEAVIQKRERKVWLSFYEERLSIEKDQLKDWNILEKKLKEALKKIATPEELEEFERWSL